MGQHNLDRVMKPRHIAVVGASEQTGTIGNALMKNLLTAGFPGQVLPINPKYSRIHGRQAYRSVADLDCDIDLAIIATPIRTVPEIVEQCIDRKIGGAIVISAGGKETGVQGVAIEQKISDLAVPHHFRIIGPNCLGMIRPSNKLNATFVSGMPPAGDLAFVSQSGAICSAILDRAFKDHIGFSHFVSIGSMIDVDFGDMIDYLGNHHSVKSILLYIENLTNFRKFMSAARSVSRVKPIIVLKAGRSPAGAKAACSHTGAMAGEDAVYDAAFKRAGIVRVDTIAELFDCAELMAKQPRSRGPRLAIVTNGGGPGVMAVDYLTRNGYVPAPLDSGTVTKLDKILPGYWSRSNPIDILGDASAERFRQVVDICLHAPDFDGILIILAPQALAEPMTVAQTVAAMIKGHKYPIFTCWMGGRSIAEGMEYLKTSGIPTFETPERAIRAFLYMVAFAENQTLLLEVPAKHSRIDGQNGGQRETSLIKTTTAGFLSEPDLRKLLAVYQLPIVASELASSEEEASRLSRSMGYPVALKLSSPEITHKTDAGGVCLDLRSDTEVRRAYNQIITSAHRYRENACVEGVAIQPFLANPDYEILLGAKRDRDFGPVILFGMGGIFTEILKDSALGLPPMNRLLAHRLMQETKAYTVLQGYRSRKPADFEQLEEMIIGVSQLLIDYPQISELDLNPVLVKDGRAIAVDARMFISPFAVSSPLHLVISPYPSHNEYRVTTEGGKRVFIRPVKPEDVPLYITLFKLLSPTSIYFRFFGALKELRPEMLCRFTQIDYDREIALVALDEDSAVEQMLGVARIIGDPDGEEGEFAVLVGDQWQGQGIGARLLQKCLLIAAQRGFKKVYGIVLKENKNMLALGEKLGFTVQRGEDPGEFELQINFGSPELVERLESY